MLGIVGQEASTVNFGAPLEADGLDCGEDVCAARWKAAALPETTSATTLQRNTFGFMEMWVRCYFTTATALVATWPSCWLVPPDTPMAPTSFPSITMGMPPSTGIALSSA